jgi:hypothetical protein
MNEADFEVMVRLRAQKLDAHVPPETRTMTEGTNLTPTREDVRTGLPSRVEAGGSYRNVVVEKRLAAATPAGPEASSRTGNAGGR